MTEKRSGTGAVWLPLLAVMLGCGAESGELFHGTGEFALSIADADGKPSVQRVATLPRLALRRGQRGGTDLVPNLRRGLERPALLVDLGAVQGRADVEFDAAAG